MASRSPLVRAGPRLRARFIDALLTGPAHSIARALLRHLLAPTSVAVIGASRRQGTVGRAILDNIRSAGYADRVHAVNPYARQIGGERCRASPGELPEHMDLAVIACPPRRC